MFRWKDSDPPLPIVYPAERRWIWKVAFFCVVGIAASVWMIVDFEPRKAWERLLDPWLFWLSLVFCFAAFARIALLWLFPFELRLDDEGVHLLRFRRRKTWPWHGFVESRLEAVHGQYFVYLEAEHRGSARTVLKLFRHFRDAIPTDPFVPGREGAERLAARINRLRERYADAASGAP